MITRRAFLSSAALASAVCAQPRPQRPMQPPAWLDPDRTEPEGTRYRTFTSRLAGGDVSYLVYLPPAYEKEPGARYPSVYWLHGLNGSQRSGAMFVSQLDAAIKAGQAPPMIAILVNGMRDAFYNDSPDGKWPLESVIVKDLVPHVDATYRTVAKRESRAVEGYSMGGYGAAHLGFKYPELFGIVVPMAAALVEFNTGRHPAIFEKMYGSDKARIEANDPFTLARKNADVIRGRTAIRLAVGDQDMLRFRDLALHELLTELKIGHEWELVPGVAHNGQLFYKTLGPAGFAFYRKALTGRSSGQ